MMKSLCLRELYHKNMKFKFTVKENICYILPCLESMYFSVDFIKLKHRIHNTITVKLYVMVAYVCKAPQNRVICLYLLFQLTAINDDKFQWSVVTDKLNAFL